MSYPTAVKSNVEFLASEKLYAKRARIALPILVRQAKAGETIYYSDLAKEIGMPNPRNLNYVLGAVGNAVIELEGRSDIGKIPLINCIVINQTNHLPGDGIDFFISKVNFGRLTTSQKRETLKMLLTEIFTFPNWDKVLEELSLQPSLVQFDKKLKPLVNDLRRRGGEGESLNHLEFKKFLSINPGLLGINHSNTGILEYPFVSGDAVDILFEGRNQLIGVEAKSKVSDKADILRGIFQCIKYKALITATMKACDKVPDSDVILALEDKFPEDLIVLKNILGIRVVDQIRMHYSNRPETI